MMLRHISRYRWLRVWLVCGVVLLAAAAGSTPPQPVHSQSDACDQLVHEALSAIGTFCADMGLNEACYGHTLVTATFQPGVSGIQFETNGDIAPLVDLQALVTKPADPLPGIWGVAMMKVQADLPDAGDQAMTFVLFGDTEVTNTVDPALAAMPTCQISIQGNNINVRSGPGTNYRVVDVLEAGSTAVANGRNTAGDWLRVDLDGAPGWVYVPLITVNCDITTLSEVEPGEAGATYTRPMQAFLLESGNTGQCDDTPDGLLVKSPAGQRAHVMVNGVELEFASAGFLQAALNGDLSVSGLNGEIAVTAFDKTVTVRPGMQTTVPLDGLEAAAPPADPAPADDLGAVPGLTRAITEGETFDPATAAELAPGMSSAVYSGGYSETTTPTSESLVGDCHWVYSDGADLVIGQPHTYDVTLHLSPDGSTLTYIDPSEDEVLLSHDGGMTYSGSFVFGESALNNYVLTFTSPTTYQLDMSFEVLSGECAGMTGAATATGVAEAGASVTPPEPVDDTPPADEDASSSEEVPSDEEVAAAPPDTETELTPPQPNDSGPEAGAPVIGGELGGRGQPYVSGEYTETSVVVEQRAVEDCYWYNADGTHTEIGDTLTYDITLDVSRDGQTITWNDDTLTRVSEDKYTGVIPGADDETIYELTIMFTSTTTYDVEFLGRLEPGSHCEGGKQLWKGTGQIKDDTSEQPPAPGAVSSDFTETDFVSGTYTETLTVQDQSTVGECIWYRESMDNPTAIGDTFTQDITITLDPAAGTLDYTIEGETFRFITNGPKTFINRAVELEGVQYIVTLHMTSPTTYDAEWFGMATGECIGSFQTSTGQGTLKAQNPG
ncbi:MAG: SH3 domain-containing protein [Anaerolineae bacterium]|nr:SH3 domain-containing protein [Anaerolineae bacterium]